MCRLLFTNIFDITKEKFLKGLSCMIHGGPDAPLCYSEHNNFKLGHNRLAILDLNKRSNQPFYSEDKRFAIIYNGEIYNYKELADTYNINLETNCDTELILKLSLKLGFENVPKLFNGMFSYIILDTVKNTFFVARDRMGVKPLYYYKKGNNYIFSSEINAIINILDNMVTLDEIAIRQYKKLRTFFNNHTVFKEIKMFPPASFLSFGGGEIQSYWEFPNVIQSPPADEELKYLVESAVEYRKISDVPIGSFLSGGLDSTLIAALAKELHTWTIGTIDCNEFEWGRLAAEKIHSVHHEILLDNSEFLKLTREMIDIRKEPLSVPNEVLIYKMTQSVKKENTVVLCGEGADELFFGYDRIFKWAAQKKYFDIREFSKLYSYSQNDDIEIVESVIEPFLKYGSPINIVAAFFQVAHLHGLLRRLDNSTMMCSVEARCPFLDFRLIERMAGVPYDYRTLNGVVKAPLKRIFKNIIPRKIIERKKIGFPVNLSNIFSVNKDSSFDYWFEYNISQLNDRINGNIIKQCRGGGICLFNYEDRRLIAA